MMYWNDTVNVAMNLCLIVRFCLCVGPCVNYSGCQITWAKFCKVCCYNKHLFPVLLSLEQIRPADPVSILNMLCLCLCVAGKHGRKRFLILGVARQHYRPSEEIYFGSMEWRVRTPAALCCVHSCSIHSSLHQSLLRWINQAFVCVCQVYYGLHQ